MWLRRIVGLLARFIFSVSVFMLGLAAAAFGWALGRRWGVLPPENGFDDKTRVAICLLCGSVPALLAGIRLSKKWKIMSW